MSVNDTTATKICISNANVLLSECLCDFTVWMHINILLYMHLGHSFVESQ